MNELAVPPGTRDNANSTPENSNSIRGMAAALAGFGCCLLERPVAGRELHPQKFIALHGAQFLSSRLGTSDATRRNADFRIAGPPKGLLGC